MKIIYLFFVFKRFTIFFSLKTKLLKKILNRNFSESQSRYLLSRRFALLVYLLISEQQETYMAVLEKSFINFGSRSTLFKVIKELEKFNLIDISESNDSRINLLKVKN